jgi:hypothetical protein
MKYTYLPVHCIQPYGYSRERHSIIINELMVSACLDPLGMCVKVAVNVVPLRLGSVPLLPTTFVSVSMGY